MKNKISEFIKNTKNINVFLDMRTHFSELSKEFSVLQLNNELLDAISGLKISIKSLFDGSQAHITLIDNDKFQLSLVWPHRDLKEDTNNRIISYPSDTFVSFITDINITYTIYELPRHLKNNVFDSSCDLKIYKEGKSRFGDPIFIEKFYQVFRVDKRTNWAALILSDKRQLPYRWEFNSESLKPVKIISVNSIDSRLKVTLRILSEIGDFHSIDTVLKLCSHESHDVRWEAINTLINLDYSLGLKILGTFLEDPHPEISKAASKSIKMLKV